MTIPYQPGTSTHTPVMKEEVLEYLKPSSGKVFVDCTLGGGGHTENIIGEGMGVRVFGFDQDQDAIKAAKQRLAVHKNITYIHDNFVNLKKHVKNKVDGILFDLGISSCQIDEPSRGFSFQKEGPLDMRMDQAGKLTAQDIINNFDADELTRLFKQYGEERFAKRIARKIVEKRRSSTENWIRTTEELKKLVEQSIPTWRKRESVARIFQALRIAVNRELEFFSKALEDAADLLNPRGRIVVISYHSLEDRIAKNFFRNQSRAGILKVLTKKPMVPTHSEIEKNPRARSARLRAAEKL